MIYLLVGCLLSFILGAFVRQFSELPKNYENYKGYKGLPGGTENKEKENGEDFSKEEKLAKQWDELMSYNAVSGGQK